MANTATATQFRPALEQLEVRAVPAGLLFVGSAGQVTAADIVPGGIITPTAMDTAADSIGSGLRQFAQ
jgi:hypothetical protein